MAALAIDSTETTLAKFALLVDPKVGLIRSVDFVKLSENDPAAHLAYADPCDTTALAGISAANKGAACAAEPRDAVIRACGECIERYCSAFFDTRALLFATEAQIRAEGHVSFSASDFYPFSRAQYESPDFPFSRHSENVPLHWVRAMSASSGAAALVPASCVYVPYRFGQSDDIFTHMPISTGLAAGPTVDYCIDKGLSEVIERDALMIVWRARMRVPRIDPASCFGLSSTIDQLLSSIDRTRGSWNINLLSLDFAIPIISVALIDPGVPPLTSFGIAANPDPVQALRSALEEALLTRMLVNRSPEIRDSVTTDDVQGIRTLRDHLLAHAASASLRSRMDFLTSGPLTRFEDLTLKGVGSMSVIETVVSAGYLPLWVEITTPDVGEAGFHVVRCLIPGMQPLDNDHRYRFEGGQRLLKVPRQFGHAVPSIRDLNPDPHPFP